MTTPYTDTDFWAKKQGYGTWSAYETANPQGVNETIVQQALEDCTEIMNDPEHINCLSTNITDSDYTPRLKIINRDMCNRVLDEDNSRGLQGANFQKNWEKWDYLTFNERKFLLQLGLRNGNRLVGGVG